MSESNVNLAALIGSRICHDLISPIGAINNGLELLDLTGSIQGPELELIADSVGNAGARIRFFRIAYGAAGEQLVGRSEAMSVLDDLGRGGRLKVMWVPTDPKPRSEVRLAFLALQCCETAMPYGGRVEVTCDEGRWTISGTADKLNIDPVLWARLALPGQHVGVTPALVQFALLPELARDMGRSVTSQADDTHISLSF